MWMLNGRIIAVKQLTTSPLLLITKMSWQWLNQRHCQATLLAMLPAMTLPSLAIAQVPTDASSTVAPPAFWPAAQKILESQVNWFDRAEIAVATPDPLTTQILSTKLLVQLRSMDLFVQRYHRNPAALCQSERSANLLGAAAGLDVLQVQTYCAIYRMSRDLTPLRDRLTQRSSLFNTERSLQTRSQSFRPSNFNQTAVNVLVPTSIEQVNLATPALPSPPDTVFVYPQMVGVQSMKQLQANYRPPVVPAIAPPPDLQQQINQGRTQLLQIQANLPTSMAARSTPSVQVFKPPTAPVAKYAVRPSAVEAYADFLAQPNTGIERVYPAGQFTADRNRLNPQNIPLPFGLRIEDGQFVIGGDALNYGFVTAIGEVDIAQVTADQPLPELFQTYAPPAKLEQIQTHQRRFLIGKDMPLSSEIPVQLRQTYVMRLVQYQIPELVTTGRPLQPGERGNLKALLAHRGTDRLIAFRPVTRRNDGSYTILWKVLDTKAAPQIEDLETYISKNLKTRSRN